MKRFTLEGILKAWRTRTNTQLCPVRAYEVKEMTHTQVKENKKKRYVYHLLSFVLVLSFSAGMALSLPGNAWAATLEAPIQPVQPEKPVGEPARGSDPVVPSGSMHPGSALSAVTSEEPMYEKEEVQFIESVLAKQLEKK